MKKGERLQLRFYDGTRLEVQFIGFTTKIPISMLVYCLNDLENNNEYISEYTLGNISEIRQID